MEKKIEKVELRIPSKDEKVGIIHPKIKEIAYPHFMDNRVKTTPVKTKEHLNLRNKRQPSDWATLIQDVVVKIFSYLSLKDRAHMAMTCRNWNAIFHLPEMWRKFQFELAQTSSSHLQPTPKGLIQMVLQRHSSHLRFVTLRMDNNKKSGEDAYEILSNLVHCSLKTLELISSAAIPAFPLDDKKFVSALTVIFVNSNTLSSLALDDSPVDDPSLESLAKSNQDSLQLLSMDSCSNASARGMIFVADQCRQLHELTVDYCHLTDELLQSLSRDEHVKLKLLRINFIKHETEEAYHLPAISIKSWTSLAQHSPQLSLIMYFYVLRDEDYSPFFFMTIPVTHIYFGRSVSQAVLGRISRYCPKLKELVICANGYDILDDELIQISKNCKELCSLGLGECEISCSGMVEIAKNCGERLSHLYVREATVLDDEVHDIMSMQEEVSKYLGRQWHVEYMPSIEF